jgi:TetR/AcrR family transcriptional regulator
VQPEAARKPVAPHDEGARERILRSAELLFAERGFPNVTVADIAAACDVSTGLIYYHFEDKPSLFKAIVDEGVAALLHSGQQALSAEGTAAERIRRWIQAYISSVLEHESLVRIVTSTRAGDERTTYSLAGFAPVIAALAATISEGTASGEFREIDPVMAAECLVGMAHIRVASRILGGAEAAALADAVEWDADAAADFVASLFIDGMRPC